jgi:hypothetical protein
MKPRRLVLVGWAATTLVALAVVIGVLKSRHGDSTGFTVLTGDKEIVVDADGKWTFVMASDIHRRKAFFKSLRKAKLWQGTNQSEFVFVPASAVPKDWNESFR